MIYRVVVYSIVYIEIVDAIIYYESIYPDLGNRFEKAIQQALDNLETKPEFYFNLEDEKHRRIPINGFPYAFIYTIEENEVIVKMLFPQFQNPERLWSRIKL